EETDVVIGGACGRELVARLIAGRGGCRRVVRRGVRAEVEGIRIQIRLPVVNSGHGSETVIRTDLWIVEETAAAVIIVLRLPLVVRRGERREAVCEARRSIGIGGRDNRGIKRVRFDGVA